VISGNITLMARGSPDGMDLQPLLRRDAGRYRELEVRGSDGRACRTNNSASVGLGTYGAAAGAARWAVGVAAGISTQHGALCALGA